MGERLLYDFGLDANCYKVRLGLSMMGITCQLVTVDAYPGHEQQKPAFQAINPLGRIPALVENGCSIDGAEAILTHLAYRYAPQDTWLPSEPSAFAATMQWCFFAAADLAPAIRARQQALFTIAAGNKDGDLRAAAISALEQMEDHMLRRQADGHDWFAASRATIADLCLFPAFALSRDYGVGHDEFPALRRWSRCLRGSAGFVSMPGIPDYY
jgi:glutathione S-transferase